MAGGDVFAQGHAGPLRVGEGGDGFGVEAVDLEEHFPMPGAQEVAALAEEEVEAAAVVFEVGGDVLDAEGHFGLLRGDVEFLEEADEVRIGGVVEDHEAGVDGDGAPGFVDGDGVGVAAGVVVLLEEGEVVMRMKEMGGSEPGDAGADDGDFGHGRRGEVFSFQYFSFQRRRRGCSCYGERRRLDGGSAKKAACSYEEASRGSGPPASAVSG